jgi:hypothetical protein
MGGLCDMPHEVGNSGVEIFTPTSFKLCCYLSIFFINIFVINYFVCILEGM